MIKKIIFFLALASLLYACGPSAPVAPTIDVDAIHTAAAETVIAEFTQTARAVPPTSAATATAAVTTGIGAFVVVTASRREKADQ